MNRPSQPCGRAIALEFMEQATDLAEARVGETAISHIPLPCFLSHVGCWPLIGQYLGRFSTVARNVSPYFKPLPCANKRIRSIALVQTAPDSSSRPPRFFVMSTPEHAPRTHQKSRIIKHRLWKDRRLTSCRTQVRRRAGRGTPRDRGGGWQGW